MRRGHATSPWCLAFALAFGACGSPTETPTPNRVIWLAIDSLSAQRLGFMGYPRPTSPWLDSLAEKSVVFESAFAPQESGATALGTGARTVAWFAVFRRLRRPW